MDLAKLLQLCPMYIAASTTECFQGLFKSYGSLFIIEGLLHQVSWPNPELSTLALQFCRDPQGRALTKKPVALEHLPDPTNRLMKRPQTQGRFMPWSGVARYRAGAMASRCLNTRSHAV